MENKMLATRWVERQDAGTALLVDQAIFLDATAGAAVAWAFLMKRGVSDQIIKRALSGRVRQIKKPDELLLSRQQAKDDAA